MPPLMMYCMEGSMPSMDSATKMIRSTNTPSTMPLILPVPPTNETPPMTQAAMASALVVQAGRLGDGADDGAPSMKPVTPYIAPATSVDQHGRAEHVDAGDRRGVRRWSRRRTCSCRRRVLFQMNHISATKITAYSTYHGMEIFAPEPVVNWIMRRGDDALILLRQAGNGLAVVAVEHEEDRGSGRR